jgi:hypothetical protein
MTAGYRWISPSPSPSYSIEIKRPPSCTLSLSNMVRQMIGRDSCFPNLTPRARTRRRSTIWSYPTPLPDRPKRRGRGDNHANTIRIGRIDKTGSRSRRVERESGLETRRENHAPNRTRRRVERDPTPPQVTGGTVRKNTDTYPSHHDQSLYTRLNGMGLWIIGSGRTC